MQGLQWQQYLIVHEKHNHQSWCHPILRWGSVASATHWTTPALISRPSSRTHTDCLLHIRNMYRWAQCTIGVVIQSRVQLTNKRGDKVAHAHVRHGRTFASFRAHNTLVCLSKTGPDSGIALTDAMKTFLQKLSMIDKPKWYLTQYFRPPSIACPLSLYLISYIRRNRKSTAFWLKNGSFLTSSISGHLIA